MRTRGPGARLCVAAILAAATLTGCAAPVAITPSLRNPETPIWSTAAPDEAALRGTWLVARSLGARADCGEGALTISGEPGALVAGFDLCTPAGRLTGEAAMRPLGPGRWEVAGLAPALWLLWMDADARTAVVAAPDGGLALVLDRTGTPSADRMAAAEDILRWNGFLP